MFRILFVCTGNTCRSAMAEGLCRAALEADAELKGAFEVASAGVMAYEGDRASENAILALREGWKLEIEDHRSKRLEEEDLESAGLVLTMTSRHKESIVRRFPQFKNKVFTLKEYVADEKIPEGAGLYPVAGDVQDPYGMSVSTYRKCAGELKEAIDKLVLKLKNIEM